ATGFHRSAYAFDQLLSGDFWQRREDGSADERPTSEHTKELFARELGHQLAAAKDGNGAIRLNAVVSRARRDGSPLLTDRVLSPLQRRRQGLAGSTLTGTHPTPPPFLN